MIHKPAQWLFRKGDALVEFEGTLETEGVERFVAFSDYETLQKQFHEAIISLGLTVERLREFEAANYYE